MVATARTSRVECRLSNRRLPLVTTEMGFENFHRVSTLISDEPIAILVSVICSLKSLRSPEENLEQSHRVVEKSESSQL